MTFNNIWRLDDIVPPNPLIAEIIEREVRKISDFVADLPVIPGREWEVEFGTLVANADSEEVRLPVHVYSRPVRGSAERPFAPED